MYMGGLGATIQRIDADECRAAGGIPSNCARVYRTGPGGWYSTLCDCFMPEKTIPAPVPAAPAQITVSPTIQTQVSPQISPVFQQQFQPTNSPATAGTSQVTPVGMAPVSSGITREQLDAALARQKEEFLAAQKPIGITAQSQLPPAPAPVPAQAPAYTAPSAPTYAPPEQLPPAPVQYRAAPDLGPAGGGSAYYEAAQTSVEPTQSQGKPPFDWKIAAIIGLGLFGVVAMSDKRKR